MIADHQQETRRRSVFDTWHGERPWPACDLSPGAHEEDAFRHTEPMISSKLAKHEAMVIAGLVGGLLLVAVLLVLILTPLRGMAGLMLVALFAVYAALLTIPVWAATILEDAEDYGRDHL